MFREKYTERWEVERKKKKLFIHRYNIIPEKALKSPILEVGAGEGLRQIECKHKDVFLQSEYLGIDLLKPIKSELNIIQADILSFKTDRKFKTIIMVGTLEHIALDKWPSAVQQLKDLCSAGGNIIIYVPYRESVNRYMIHAGDHLVYGITKEFMWHFFPNAYIKIIYDQMIRRHDESFIWATGRWVKRLLMLDKKVLKIIPKRVGLLVIWNKRQNTELETEE